MNCDHGSPTVAKLALAYLDIFLRQCDKFAEPAPNQLKISDFTCPSCISAYEVAESSSTEANPGRADCTAANFWNLGKVPREAGETV
jgi:hypothetical protein